MDRLVKVNSLWGDLAPSATKSLLRWPLFEITEDWLVLGKLQLVGHICKVLDVSVLFSLSVLVTLKAEVFGALIPNMLFELISKGLARK